MENHAKRGSPSDISNRMTLDIGVTPSTAIVAIPTKSGEQVTLQAERICRVKPTDVDIYAKEMSAVHETLQVDKIQPIVSKRPAGSKIQETPSKKFAPAFLVQ